MEISLDSSQLEKRKWVKISRAIQTLLVKNKYKILKIVDGVDNININDDGSKVYYRHMIHCAQKFVRFRPSLSMIHLMSLRERTYFDIKRLYPIQEDTIDYILNTRIHNKCAKFKDIIKARYEYPSDQHNNYSDLFWSISKKITEHIDDDTSTLHHNNVRSFLHNKLTLIPLVYYRIKQLNINNPDIKNHIRDLEYRNKFLNGRLFLRTFNEWSSMNKEMGLCCMNIFYYNRDNHPGSYPDNWYGLVKTRILQMVMDNSNLTKMLILKSLVDVFEYPAKLVTDGIKDLRAFGMIDSHYNAENNTIIYKISDKGQTHLIYSHSNIDMLYFFSLDTLLPQEFINKNLINSHHNNFLHRNTEYQYSSVTTVITFILFLQSINYIEKKRLQSFLERYNIDKHEYIHSVELPLFEHEMSFNELLYDLNEVIDLTDNKSLNSINNYFNLLKGYKKP